REARGNARLLPEAGGPARVVRILGLRRRDALIRQRAPRLALRFGRDGLGQHRAGHGHVALVQLPADGPRRRLPHGRSDDATHQRSGHLSSWQVRRAGVPSQRAPHGVSDAREPRISRAESRRFYYYLTADERTGDIMREVLNVDYKVVEYDPMRLAQPITEAEKKYPTRVRLGPDWLAFVSNW